MNILSKDVWKLEKDTSEVDKNVDETDNWNLQCTYLSNNISLKISYEIKSCIQNRF